MTGDSICVFAGVPDADEAQGAVALHAVSNRFSIMCARMFGSVKQFRATNVGKISVAKRHLLIDPAGPETVSR
jgi:hypothetical protein